MTEIEIFRTGGSSLDITGRLLGLLTPKHHALLQTSHEFRRRLSSRPTMPLATITSLTEEEIKGKRLVMVMKTKDNVSIGPVTFFVSDAIDFINHSNHKDDASLTTLKDHYMTITESA